uniref:Protein interacting with cyclin A1 n=1 Tax=Gasterosteus aculeatus aculeatus TaxID=481459 RepID=A0AAQ4QRM0_GASAC
MSTVRESFLYQVSDGAEVVRSVISPTGMFGNCSVTANQMQVKSFMHECRLGLKEHRADQQMEARFARTDEAKRMCREFKERSERRGTVVKGDDSQRPDKVFKRSKRGFTYPGTLWCGAGNMADHYDQLGGFYEFNIFKLKDCLRKVNDTSSRVVGQAFFNVIGVPCFELAYEDQCAERHWYGLCKRYEKFPIAVLREAVPYDFGGIDAIDALPLPLSKTEDSEKSKDDVKPESTTQSPMSGPEEPSLRNVVTAAEDFIKVLATVSTSQSSTADSSKSESQSSEKKKRKNTGRKKKTNKKPKGKGRKRKQKAEEGAAVSPSGSKAEEVIALSNVMAEQHQHQQSSRNRVDDREHKMEEKEEPFNEVMKDEPSIDKEIVSITSPTTVQRKPAESSEETIPSPPAAVSTHKGHSRKHRKGRKKKTKNISLPPSTELDMNTTNNVGVVFPPTATTKTQTARPEQQSSVVSTASTPIRFPNVKRNRSKERGDRKGRKKRRKLNSASSIVAAAQENSSTDNLKVIPLTGAPTVPSVSAAERKVSHKMDVYTGKTTVRATAPNFTVRKREKLKGPRSRRRKTVIPLLSENPLFPNGSENVIPIVTTQEKSDAVKRPHSASAGGTDGHSEWMLFTAVTAAPSVVAQRHRQRIQQQRRPHMKAKVALLTDGASIPKQTEHALMTLSPTPLNVATTEVLNLQIKEQTHGITSATTIMRPMQLSIDRAKAQFTRKKRRKAALSVRQQ